MSDAQHTYDIAITVNGAPLNPSVADLLISALVDDSTEQADVFELRFRDAERTVLLQGGFLLGSTVTVKMKPGGAAVGTTLMEGEITTIKGEYDESVGSVAVVSGFDKSHTLFRGRKNKNFKMMKASDIVSKVAMENGLLASVDATTTVYQHLSQANESDWMFLKRLADHSGRTLTVSGKKLSFKKAGVPSPPIVLEAGEHLLSVSAGLTTNEQVKNVVAQSYDPVMQVPVTGRFPVLVTASSPGMVLPMAHGTARVAGDYVASNQPLTNAAEAMATAMAMSEKIADGYVDLQGETYGNPSLRAGSKVQIKGLGLQFNGTYQVTSTRHIFRGNDSYTTEFAVTGPRDDSILGLAATPAPSGAPAREVVHGVMVGVVTDNNDQQKLGRVKVKIPSLGDTFETNWAIVLYPGAGGGAAATSGRGLQLVPEVSDHVLVAFEQGDINFPYVIGSFYTARQMPPVASPVAARKVTGRKLMAENGDSIFLDQTTGTETITIASKDGKVKIGLGTGSGAPKRTITIETEGDVVVKAGKDASVTADGNVSVESKGNTKVKSSGQLSIEAASALSLKGSTVKIEGSGPVEVKGAVIKLN